MSKQSSLLVKNAKLLRPDLTVSSGDIYVEDGRIVEIGKTSKEADQVLDASGKLVMPGLVNLHTHSPMSLMRGVSDDLELMPWLQKIWKIEPKLTEEDMYIGGSLALLEMIKTGTTAFLDMYWYLDGVAKAAKELGIRAFLSWAMVDPDKTQIEHERLAKEFIKRWKGDELVRPSVGPHAVYTCGEETLLKAKDIAEKNDTLIHLHLAETREENEGHVKAYGERPIPWLEKIGFLSERLVAAHVVWVTKGEIRTLAKYGVKVAHNPTSNMKLATGGVMPWPEMKEAGLTVGLGTDSAVSNNNLDMFEEMKVAAILQKAHRWNPEIMKAGDALDMATLDGAKALGLDYGIKENALADFILVDLKHYKMVPHINLVSNLVYSATGDVVTDVVVNGKMVMNDRRVPGEEEIVERALKRAEELVSS